MIEFDLLLYRGICISLQMIEGLYQLFMFESLIFLILCFDPSYIHLFFFMLIASVFPLHQFVMLFKSYFDEQSFYHLLMLPKPCRQHKGMLHS